jgi:membrane protein required for colicin V production
MNWVDLVLLGVFAFALCLGFRKGFVKQVATLGSLILGVCLAGRYHAELAQSPTLASVTQELGEGAALVAAYLGIFAGIVLGGQIVAAIVRRSIQGKAVEYVDNLFGGLLGLAKVYLVCGLAAAGAFQLLPAGDLRTHLSASYFAPHLADSTNQLLSRIPPEYRAALREFMNRQAIDGDTFPAARRVAAKPGRSPVGRTWFGSVTDVSPGPSLPAVRRASSPCSGWNGT